MDFWITIWHELHKVRALKIFSTAARRGSFDAYERRFKMRQKHVWTSSEVKATCETAAALVIRDGAGENVTEVLLSGLHTDGAGCVEYFVFLTMFSLGTVLRKRKWYPWSSVCLCWRQRGPSCLPLMHHLPFNRMQLWIFPSQRDNEVSSSAENEAVVCPGGSWGPSKQAEPGLCRGGASPEIPPSWLLTEHQVLLGNTFYLCQKMLLPDSWWTQRKGHYCRLLKSLISCQSPSFGIQNDRPSTLKNKMKS